VQTITLNKNNVFLLSFVVRITDIATKARQIVAQTVHILRTISIANVLSSQLPHSGATISLDAIVTRINHEIISQFATPTAATSTTKLGDASHTHQNESIVQ
jgi:hypothetical protein